MHLTLSIPRFGKFTIASLEEASRTYGRIRDESGEGGSTFREGIIRDGKTVVGRVSYNGRIWAPGAWSPGDKPIFDNRQGLGLI